MIRGLIDGMNGMIGVMDHPHSSTHLGTRCGRYISIIISFFRDKGEEISKASCQVRYDS